MNNNLISKIKNLFEDKNNFNDITNSSYENNVKNLSNGKDNFAQFC